MSRRLTRREIIIGGAGVLAAGTAAGFAISRNGDKQTPSSPLPTTPPATATAGPSPTTTPLPAGGVAHLAAAGRLAFDTFDAQYAGDPSVVEVLGRTHSRILEWADPSANLLVGGLANEWEQADPETLILRLRSDAHWHDRPPLNGRPVKAADVVNHLQRLAEAAASGKAPLAQRYGDVSSIATVDSPADGQVRIRLSRLDALLPGALAGEFAFVQAPQAVEAFAASWPKAEASEVIGSGAWVFEGRQDGVLAFTPWRFGHLQPALDRLLVSEPFALVQRFGNPLTEVVTRDRRDALALRAKPGTRELQRLEREVVMSSFASGGPWNNPELLLALSGALNRDWLLNELFGGRAEPSGPLPPAYGSTALAESALAAFAGYGPDAAAEATAARQRWNAAGGPGLGAITVDFPSIFDPLYSASSIVTARLNEVLGNQFRPAVETYTAISKRVAEGYYGNGRAAFWFGWGPSLPSPDPRRYLLDTYASPAEALSAEPTDTALRRALDGASDSLAEFQRLRLAAPSGVINWVQQRSELFRLDSHSGPVPSPFWQQHLDYLRHEIP